MKGVHYLLTVQGDRVKPDNILLVVLGCDKPLATAVPVSDIPGAPCQHLGAKQRLQQGHRCLDKTHLNIYNRDGLENIPSDCLTHTLFVFPRAEG